MAKTNNINAQIIAQNGQVMKPNSQLVPDTQEFKELMARLSQIIEMIADNIVDSKKLAKNLSNKISKIILIGFKSEFIKLVTN